MRRPLGAEVRVCAPSDCAERLAEVGVPLVDAFRNCLTPGTRGQATAVARTMRTDEATAAATLLLDRS